MYVYISGNKSWEQAKIAGNFSKKLIYIYYLFNEIDYYVHLD